ncbi:MAG: Asp-tRNA(Asn)/Glu-tRNA(Gln) amidotransferase subunit GatB [Oscillospiraceae bacterium]|jgi:aspartyl-tRNA(Asn)/glutamyl-tRNA(Gln) amidotransferase subunit B|nr:Asp-tRNA(Asn)/Glu-tRNA(Gln) amidotransferase subunit GatB [Oscillospiraceae bacterium]
MLKPTIGLEIHAELLTQSKVFCTCPASFGGSENSRCCPVCSGLPGTLPVLNQKAVEFIIRAGMATECDISLFTKWDRKNYFYPDLPKAYQISQMPRPVCLNGKVRLKSGKVIRINRIHLEEDAGKLTHEGGATLADYNRCGIPLIELVTEPDFASAEEVTEFVAEIRARYMYCGISDGKMEQGSLRVDVNISLADEHADTLGTRSEIKNLNSLRSIARAIEYETHRQGEILGKGGKVTQETLRFSDGTGETSSLRSKEDAHDYRYFPDPDIPPVLITEEEIAVIRGTMPEMPSSRYDRYVNKCGIPHKDAENIVADKHLSDFFDEAATLLDEPRKIANYLLSELLYRINLGEGTTDNLPFTPADFVRVIELVEGGKVSRSHLKDILREMLATGSKPDSICEQNNYLIKEDLSLVSDTIDKILAENVAAVAQLKNGEQKVFGFLMGKANSLLKGAATPKIIKETLEKKLK